MKNDENWTNISQSIENKIKLNAGRFINNEDKIEIE